METIRAKPIDTKHLILSALGFLAVYCVDLTIHPILSVASESSAVDVLPFDSNAREQKRVDPVCTISETNKSQHETYCDSSKEKRHDPSTLKTA